jgi:phage tail protein X
MGLDILFGKYYEITYSIISKILFRNVGLVDNGVVICAMASMLPHMPSGIGTFEQVRWDLQLREAAAIDTPVLLIELRRTWYHTSPSNDRTAYLAGRFIARLREKSWKSPLALRRLQDFARQKVQVLEEGQTIVER